ncbi:unnamed protein product [Rhodiola kirilowii]
MPSGAKRRKAAKKKREKKTSITNGIKEVKVSESDRGENSSPALQEPEPQQNPFNKDAAMETSPETESMENSKGNGVVEETVGDAMSDNAGKADMQFSSLKESVDNCGVEQLRSEKERSNLVAENKSIDEEAIHAKDAACFAQGVQSNAVVLEKVSTPVGESVCRAAEAELTPKKKEEKVHPSETFDDYEESSGEKLPLSEINLGQPSDDIVGNHLLQSNIPAIKGEWHAGSSGIQQSVEKEPLLLKAPRPMSKTSWTGCCGLLELFTGQSG